MFMGLGLVWLVPAATMPVAQPTLLRLPHPHPQVVALTHTYTWPLGFLVTVACGAVYQIVPVAPGTTLANERPIRRVDPRGREGGAKPTAGAVKAEVAMIFETPWTPDRLNAAGRHELRMD